MKNYELAIYTTLMVSSLKYCFKNAYVLKS